MSENSKNNSFIEKMKNTKVNRATVITTFVLIAAIAVIVSVTVASNRTKDNPKPPVNTPDTNETDTDTETETETETETTAPTPSKPSGGSSSQVQNKLPSFDLPVSGVLSEKHDPTLQVFSDTLKDYRVHLGIDIATDADAPVYAAANGTISKIWKDEMMGYCMAIKHSGDSYTIYKNLAEELPSGIAEGVSVRSGQLIASVGESALVEIAEEPHLHFEMTVADLMVDPLEYFSQTALDSLSIDSSFE